MLRCKRDAAQEELERMKSVIHDLAKDVNNAPFVEALCEVKGIDVLSAMVIRAEFCDFARFSSGRKVSSWLGTVPKNNSSGERNTHGSITKAGNRYLRRTLVEGVCAISTWKKTSTSLLPTSHLARQATARMMDRYHHLTADLGKNTNKAKIAVVNEMMSWCWVIGREVQKGQMPLT